MNTNHLRRGLTLFGVSFVVSILLSIGCISTAQNQSLLGYSEAPFEVVEDLSTAVGETPLDAVRAASATAVLEENLKTDTLVEYGDYAFMTISFNHIGMSTVTQKSGDQWQFVCRAGGLMTGSEMHDQCAVPLAVAGQLYNDLLAASAVNE